MKPEDNQVDIDGKPILEPESYVLKPQTKTFLKIDGLKINGIVYKVTNGYTGVVIGKDYIPIICYNEGYDKFIFLAFGGQKNKGDYGVNGANWDNLFNK